MAKGFTDAGHEVTGVDITDDHQYLYDFIHSDVFKLKPEFLTKFDLIHASPPCQFYSWSTKKNRTFEKYPDLIGRTRQLLLKTNKPYIIENVIGAPLRKDLRLCGEMFGLRVLRHRLFEIHGFTVLQPPHIKHHQPISKNHSYYAGVFGHGGQSFSTSLKTWQDAMSIHWISKKKHLAQAIPPKYAEYIGRYL
jgi:DNA (cytosine-5)-methyltransferase 1